MVVIIKILVLLIGLRWIHLMKRQTDIALKKYESQNNEFILRITKIIGRKPTPIELYKLLEFRKKSPLLDDDVLKIIHNN